MILDDRTLGVLNDSNFPFSSGRTPGRPDNNEFITIRLDGKLHADHRILRPDPTLLGSGSREGRTGSSSAGE